MGATGKRLTSLHILLHIAAMDQLISVDATRLIVHFAQRFFAFWRFWCESDQRTSAASLDPYRKGMFIILIRLTGVDQRWGAAVVSQ